jgi:hypothetical protein
MKHALMIFFHFILIANLFAADRQDILKEIDRYRLYSNSFQLKIRITEYKNDKQIEQDEFIGYFKDSDRSVLYCTNGNNKDMKVLMRNDHMWINLPGSARAIRITPMQRLLGQASTGDIAKISFARDYKCIVEENEGDELKLLLKAKSDGATYQKIMLYVNNQTYKPVKAEFFLLSGKHFKTAYYTRYSKINSKDIVTEIKIIDEVKHGYFSIIESIDYKNRNFPAKYFNVRYLSEFRIVD